MYAITQWVAATALANAGFSESQVDDVMRSADLPQFVESEAGRLIAKPTRATAFVESTRALITLGRNFRMLANDPAELREVMSVAHFTTYFGDAISREFLRQYDYAASDLMSLVAPDSAPDFRPVKRLRMTEPDDLTVRGEKEMARETSVSDGLQGQMVVGEYARTFDVSWRVLVNDDLGEIQKVPNRMALAARRWRDKFVSSLYDNATTQAGLAGLGATYKGTGRLSIANLTIGINAMTNRTDAKGNKIVFPRVWLVIPSVSQVDASQILSNVINFGGTNSNVLSKFIAGVAVDPYMDTAGVNIPWYLIADPQSVSTIPLLRMNGWPAPIVARRNSDMQLLQGTAPAAFALGDFLTGNIQYLVEDVLGGNNDATYGGVLEPVGIYYSDGTTA